MSNNYDNSTFENGYKKLPVMIHSIDTDGNLLDVNDFWVNTMGYEKNEVIGKKSTFFLTDQSASYALDNVLPNFFKSGHCENIPYQFVKKDGSLIDVLLSATSIKDDKGNVLHSIAIIINITDNSLIGYSTHKEITPIDKLIQLRTKKNVSQMEMSEILSISPRTYQRIEYGESTLSVAHIIEAANYFKVNPHYFF